jgi:putative transposase
MQSGVDLLQFKAMGHQFIIYGKFRKEIGAILRRLCQDKGVDVIEGNAGIDRIHVCLSIPP